MANLPFITPIRRFFSRGYNWYVGKVDVIRDPKGSINSVRILDITTGEDVREVYSRFGDKFVDYEGKIIRFMGKFNKELGVVIPHIE